MNFFVRIISFPLRYAGKLVDAKTGFLYFGARYYDLATLCRLSLDPLEDANGPKLLLSVTQIVAIYRYYRSPFFDGL